MRHCTDFMISYNCRQICVKTVVVKWTGAARDVKKQIVGYLVISKNKYDPEL